jgi:hypothetical protein
MTFYTIIRKCAEMEVVSYEECSPCVALNSPWDVARGGGVGSPWTTITTTTTTT